MLNDYVWLIELISSSTLVLFFAKRIFNLIREHSILLYGHRIEGESGLAEYRVAVQNAEPFELRGPLRLSLSCVGGAIEGEVLFFAGQRPIRVQREGRTFSVDVDEIREYDTWLFRFKATCSRVRVSIDSADPAKGDPASRLSTRTLDIDASSIAFSGRSRAPLGPIFAWTALTCAGVYVATALLTELGFAGAEQPFGIWDLAVISSLLAIVALALGFSRPPSVAVIQGYLEKQRLGPA